MSYNVGSFFAGVGGICLGFKNASKEYKLKIANELDNDAIKTYKTNFKHDLIEGDIEKILNPEILKIENEFLIKKLKTLKEQKIIEINEVDLNLIKQEVKKHLNKYIQQYLFSNNFSISKSIKEKSYYLKEQIKNFEIIVEISIIEELLSNRTSEWILLEIAKLEEKKKGLLKHKIDILTGGFPCQAFSIAGERKGFNDHRGNLFFSILNFVKLLEDVGHQKPRILFLENVKNLISHDNGNTFKIIIDEIKKIGYNVKYSIMNTADYTELPQNRERIIIVCFLKEEDYNNFENFSDIKKIIKTKESLINSLKNIINYDMTKETGSIFYYSKEKYPKYYQTKINNSDNEAVINIDEQVHEMFQVYQLRRGLYIRQNKSGLCPTLTANMGTGGHNVPLIKVKDGVRKLTPKECFDLQGFQIDKKYILPKDVSNASLYKQSGNAVSVPLIELIAKKILVALKKTDN